MNRRAFVSGALALLAAPRPAAAQQRVGVMKIGILSGDAPGHRDGVKVFRRSLEEIGYTEGGRVLFEERFAKTVDLFATAAKALVAADIDVLVAFTTQAAMAAKAATTTVPIVFALVSDPVDAGLVASLARPGGNATGLALMQPDLSAKQLQFLKEMLPSLSRVAVLWNATHRGKILEFREIQAAARVLGTTIVSGELRTAGDFDEAFAKFTRERVQAVIVLSEPLVSSRDTDVRDFVAKRRLPSMGDSRLWVTLGGFLMSYAPDEIEQFRRAAAFVDRIVRGARPAEVAVERPTKFDLVISLKTAKALGLTIPPSLLLRADQVIE